MYVTVNRCGDKVCEVRATIGRSGICQHVLIKFIAYLLSLIMQNCPEQIIRKMVSKGVGTSCHEPFFDCGKKYLSCVDSMCQTVLEQMGDKHDNDNKSKS